MKKFLFFISIFLMRSCWAQLCPMCKLSLLNSPEGRHMVQSFNHGILFLLAMPYLLFLIVGAIVFYFFRTPEIR